MINKDDVNKEYLVQTGTVLTNIHKKEVKISIYNKPVSKPRLTITSNNEVRIKLDYIDFVTLKEFSLEDLVAYISSLIEYSREVIDDGINTCTLRTSIKEDTVKLLENKKVLSFKTSSGKRVKYTIFKNN